MLSSKSIIKIFNFCLNCVTNQSGDAIVLSLTSYYLRKKQCQASVRGQIQKKPLTETRICQGRINRLSAVPPCIHGQTMHLIRILTYPGQLTYVFTLQNTLYIAALHRMIAAYAMIVHLTAPSAVHLTTCFLPGSQHPRLSVKASLPLSPHQRFPI